MFFRPPFSFVFRFSGAVRGLDMSYRDVTDLETDFYLFEEVFLMKRVMKSIISLAMFASLSAAVFATEIAVV
ncbi:hypothetical protein, partial [Pyramidobacter sp. CG50-2]|uniref:hypothetical protein n=1 Tax=Pyramidobacter sp. CG50-2 TaxID=2382160 RepID=UPI000EDD4ED6